MSTVSDICFTCFFKVSSLIAKFAPPSGTDPVHRIRTLTAQQCEASIVSTRSTIMFSLSSGDSRALSCSCSNAMVAVESVCEMMSIAAYSGILPTTT